MKRKEEDAIPHTMVSLESMYLLLYIIQRTIVERLHALLQRQQPQVDVLMLPEFEAQRKLLIGPRRAIRP